jgi:hypothetical protein
VRFVDGLAIDNNKYRARCIRLKRRKLTTSLLGNMDGTSDDEAAAKRQKAREKDKRYRVRKGPDKEWRESRCESSQIHKDKNRAAIQKRDREQKRRKKLLASQSVPSVEVEIEEPTALSHIRNEQPSSATENAESRAAGEGVLGAPLADDMDVNGVAGPGSNEERAVPEEGGPGGSGDAAAPAAFPLSEEDGEGPMVDAGGGGDVPPTITEGPTASAPGPEDAATTNVGTGGAAVPEINEKSLVEECPTTAASYAAAGGATSANDAPPCGGAPALSPRATAEPAQQRPKRRCTERSRKPPPVLPLKPPPPAAAPRSRTAHGGERSVATNGGAGSGDVEGSHKAAGADNANEQPPLVLCDAIMFDDDDDEDDVSMFGKPSFRKTREQVVKVLLSGGMKKRLAARALAEEKAVAKGEKKEEDVSCMEISGGRFELFLGT